ENLAGLLVDDVFCAVLADDVRDVDGQALELRRAQLADGGLRELAVLADDDLFADLDVTGRALVRQQVVLDALRVAVVAAEEDRLRAVEEVEEILRGVAEGLEEHRRVHLPTAVDADVEQVLRVELEV